MKQFISIIACVWLLAGCQESCMDKRNKAYRENIRMLSQTRKANNISLQMSYFPSYMLPDYQKDTSQNSAGNEYYYFKLMVHSDGANKTPVFNTQVNITGQSILYYGLDSLFTAGERKNKVTPLLVQPVMKGSIRDLEYLLVFNKADFDNTGNDINIVFNDRLFTQSIQNFFFSKKSISLLETISCEL